MVAMELNLPPDLENLVHKRLASGSYVDVEDGVRSALETQDALESWTDEERASIAGHVEEGYLQAERGELIDGDQAPRELQAMKEMVRRERSLKR